MWLLLATVIGAVIVVALTGGRFTEIANLRIRSVWLLGVGLAIQIALEYISFPKHQIESVGYALLMMSYAFILAFGVANLRTKGFGIIAIGIAMNALVIGLNQGMPTKPVGSDSHGNRILKPVAQTVKHRQERGDDLLGFLGDKILLPRPFDTLVSFGDLIIAVGICELAFYGSRRVRNPALRSNQTAAR